MKHLSFQPGDTLAVVSDIHGGIHILKRLLTHIQPSSHLIILGDIIEKGFDSLKTLRYIQSLSQNPNVHVCMGNNDDAFLRALEPENIHYFLRRKHDVKSIIYQMIESAQLDGDGFELQTRLKEVYHKEIEWLRQLELMIETDDFIFVHAGIERRMDYQQSDRKTLLSLDHFYDKGHIAPKIVVCGHYPTAIYSHHNFNNNVIIDLEKRIICIDGGYGATNFGQINLLEITYTKEGYQYRMVEDDDFESRRIIQSQKAKGHTRGVCYPHYAIEVIEKGHHFSLARVVQTNEVVYVKNEYIRNEHNQTFTTDDVPNNWLEVKVWDEVKILNQFTSGYALVKKQGEFGWVSYDCIENLTQQIGNN